MLDLDRLLKLRLVVARHGEMDRAGWWNTLGMLGPNGATALRRGLPRTHRFVQARVVFAVAKSRCEELFDPPAGCVTLWRLPASVEDEVEEHWHDWLAAPEPWTPLLDQLTASTDTPLLTELGATDLIGEAEVQLVEAMRRSAEGRAIELHGEHHLTDELVTLLAAGFAKGEQGAPAIPYARLPS
jgi:hypothetical protein